MKKGLARHLRAAACALLVTGCVIYDFGGNLGPWSFEDGTNLPDGFQTSLDSAWTVDATTANEGSCSVRSGSPAPYAISVMTLTVDKLDTGKDLHFWYKISGSYSDVLELYINNSLAATYNGSDSYGYWTSTDVWDSYLLDDGGTNTFEWRYRHGTTDDFFNNCAWVDDVLIDG
jgi:hypothetical protein